MSLLYLVRHGQAGSRFTYDALSSIGHQQTELLGRYLAAEPVRFERIFSGSLQRQRESAQNVIAAYRAAGVDVPEPQVDSRWDEFDLDKVYNGLAPQLSADDPEFRAEYEAMMAACADPNSTLHREATSCDIKVIKAWISGEYKFEGETWVDFMDRITGALESLKQYAADGPMAVFSSATPTAVCVAHAMGVHDARAVRFAAMAMNASYTVFDIQPTAIAMVSFNNAPHLRDPHLQTYR